MNTAATFASNRDQVTKDQGVLPPNVSNAPMVSSNFNIAAKPSEAAPASKVDNNIAERCAVATESLTAELKGIKANAQDGAAKITGAALDAGSEVLRRGVGAATTAIFGLLGAAQDPETKAEQAANGFSIDGESGQGASPSSAAASRRPQAQGPSMMPSAG